MTNKESAPVQISDSVYWLGSSDREDFLQTNSYLVFREGKGILIDPGPVPSFPAVLNALVAICSLDRVIAIVVSHQDPDITASLPLWEEQGFRGTLIAHWRTGMLVKAFGLKNTMLNINESRTETLEEFLSLRFLSFPYLHSPGNMVTYDEISGTLFSSDLFGALGRSLSLFAEHSYTGRMIYFHENYMPSEVLLRDFLDQVEPIPGLQMICPQHGSIIREELSMFINALRQAHCDVVKSSNRPDSNLEETAELKRINFELQESLVLNNDDKLKDPVTELYNKNFFQSLLPIFQENNPDGLIVYFRLDGMKTFNHDYGYEEGDRAISTFARILQDAKSEEYYLLREAGPILILMMPDRQEDSYLSVLEEFQNLIRESEEFIQRMTCSAAIVMNQEIPHENSKRFDTFHSLMRSRLRVLDRMGPQAVCNYETESMERSEKIMVFIIESDPVLSQILEDYFTSRDCFPVCCSSGAKALHEIDLQRPDIIISEVNVPQLDGFRIRQQLIESSDLREIPFIFISHLKSEATVFRAFQLGVDHYLKKPVMMAELYGLVRFLGVKE